MVCAVSVCEVCVLCVCVCAVHCVDPYGETPLLPDADEKKEIGSHEITSSVVAELLKGL